ncbi:MAG TPA: ATP synthase F1 subunit gamma [Candidatus Saccharimonadales bacterium]|nr:ATP synthase F1 subunit gamma [Candidatus Saccharimonadales bacterium]
MASRQQIKRRIGSVRNTRQITRAMQLMSASKLRRAQDAVLGPREYSAVAREMLTQLRRLSENNLSSGLFEVRPVRQRLIVAISSNQGLAGAYDPNVIRRLIQELGKDRKDGVQSSVIPIGRKVAQAVSRLNGVTVPAAYNELPDKPEASDLRPLLNTIVDQFTDGDIDAVDLVFTRFKSTMSQEVMVQRLLPAGFEELEVSPEIAHATVEPSLEELVRAATIRLLEAQLYQARLESVASEQSMRMIAMKNATDNASDLIDDLTLEYNNARQAAITQELAEISGGAEALNG